MPALEAAESANPIRTRWEKAAAASDRASRNGAEESEAESHAQGESSLLDSPDAESSEGTSGESDAGGASRFE